MNTANMTIGDLVYRLIVGRDPPWNHDYQNVVAVNTRYRRPEKIIEWAHALNPLRIRFCSCGALHEIIWIHGYATRTLYPQNPPYTTGVCAECAKLNKMLDGIHSANIEF